MLHPLDFDGVLQEGTELDVVSAEKMANRGTYRMDLQSGWEETLDPDRAAIR